MYERDRRESRTSVNSDERRCRGRFANLKIRGRVSTGWGLRAVNAEPD
jgi:hypothetical protein